MYALEKLIRKLCCNGSCVLREGYRGHVFNGQKLSMFKATPVDANCVHVDTKTYVYICTLLDFMKNVHVDSRICVHVKHFKGHVPLFYSQCLFELCWS